MLIFYKGFFYFYVYSMFFLVFLKGLLFFEKIKKKKYVFKIEELMKICIGMFIMRFFKV